ncbi:MAG TPA: TRAP transporter small permease [Clostridia bacterium]|nr:TRAP transporter small permease [Clostridia bacterium]
MKYLDKLEENILVILVSAMTFVVLLQVANRFIINAQMQWTGELSRFLFVWNVFIAASYGVRENAHIGVKAIVNYLPEHVSKICENLVYIICLIFSILVIYFGFSVIIRQTQLGQSSPALRIPMGLPYLGVPLGFTFISLRFIQKLYGNIRSDKA